MFRHTYSLICSQADHASLWELHSLQPQENPIPPSKRIYRQNHTQKFAWFSGYLESVEMIGGLRFTLLPPQRTTRMSLFSTMFFCLCSHHMWPLCVSSSPVVKPNHRVTAPARGRAATTRFIVFIIIEKNIK